jgi:hypothetical protein
MKKMVVYALDTAGIVVMGAQTRRAAAHKGEDYAT